MFKDILIKINEKIEEKRKINIENRLGVFESPTAYAFALGNLLVFFWFLLTGLHFFSIDNYINLNNPSTQTPIVSELNSFIFKFIIFGACLMPILLILNKFYHQIKQIKNNKIKLKFWCVSAITTTISTSFGALILITILGLSIQTNFLSKNLSEFTIIPDNNDVNYSFFYDNRKNKNLVCEKINTIVEKQSEFIKRVEVNKYIFLLLRQLFITRGWANDCFTSEQLATYLDNNNELIKNKTKIEQWLYLASPIDRFVINKLNLNTVEYLKFKKYSLCVEKLGTPDFDKNNQTELNHTDIHNKCMETFGFTESVNSAEDAEEIKQILKTKYGNK
jgi:hypothetical protein